MKTALIGIRDKIGTAEAAAGLNSFLEQYKDYIPHDQQTQRTAGRDANLSDRLSDAVQLAAYQHFLDHGTLLPPVDWTTDEEYLSGALMGLAQDLQQYGLGRATVRDVASVQAACDLTAAILDFLLELDFRNGPLRRKYDGTKYSLKALETILYELAVTSSTTTESSVNGQLEPKRPKRESSSQQLLLPPNGQLPALQGRMEHRDALRESLIKKCRDGQKAAKQSIYALHRGDAPKAYALLRQCATCIREDLLPIVEEEPPLRSGGSLGNVVEEYVEAKLFAVWLHGAGADGADAEATMDKDNNGGKPSGVLLLPEHFEDVISLSPEEYIGGLCDLTGKNFTMRLLFGLVILLLLLHHPATHVAVLMFAS